MSFNYLQVSTPIICLLINALIQVFVARFSKFGLLRSIYLGFGVGLACVFLLEFYVFSLYRTLSLKDFIGIFITNLISYLSLGYCYFHFINLGETARRIRILRELYESKGGLTGDEIILRYNAKEIVEKRINRLLNNGQILLRDGKYYIGKPFMLLIARVIIMAKVIILGKRSEFDNATN